MTIHSEYLELAIALAVIFFLASLIVSGLNEGVAHLLQLRAKFLWAWLHDQMSEGAAALPKSWREVLRWKGGRDARPTSDATNDEHSWVRDVLEKLAPVELSVQKGPSAGRTKIKHIPPGSLAQALLEVFSDYGRSALAESLPHLLDADTDVRSAAVTKLTDLLASGDPAQRAEVLTATSAFADTYKADASARSSAAGTFAAALVQVKGAHGDATLRPALEKFASAEPGDRAAKSEAVISALARVFPEVLVRQRINEALAGLEGTPLASTVKRLWDTATGEMDKFRLQLERWLDDDLNRLGGLYKRRVRWIMVVFGIGVAIVLNIDAVDVGRNLWRNPAGRAGLVAIAEKIDDDTQATPGAAGATTTAAWTLESIRAACVQDPAVVPTSTTVAPTPDQQVKNAARIVAGVENCVADSYSALKGLGVIDQNVTNFGDWWHEWISVNDFWPWFWHLIGVAVTAAALALGAPFWFDIIKRATGLRRGLVGDT